MTEFQFGSGVAVHKFCKTCGSSIGGEVKAADKHMIAINVRLFEDIDVSRLSLKHDDRKSYGTNYVYPHFPSGSDATLDHSLVAYHGNCQCKTVTFTAYLSSLSETEVIEDNCSICAKNGYILAYPKPKDVVFHSGSESLATYTFNTKRIPHRFCQKCGSSVYLDRTALGRDDFGMNVRMFKDVDLNALKYRYFDGKTLL
ncbi:hypothetical protein HWV62_33797 [Athelia sp. TMB]|nr:hypothetical protein HWV62_33797 [Athelia sp. TMB]